MFLVDFRRTFGGFGEDFWVDFWTVLGTVLEGVFVHNFGSTVGSSFDELLGDSFRWIVLTYFVSIHLAQEPGLGPSAMLTPWYIQCCSSNVAFSVGIHGNPVGWTRFRLQRHFPPSGGHDQDKARHA